MANGNKVASRGGYPKVFSQGAAKGAVSGDPAVVLKAASPETLSERMNGVCATLAACEEVLEAIAGRVVGQPSSDECGIPHDPSLSGAVGVADMRANDLLANLRQLASVIGA